MSVNEIASRLSRHPVEGDAAQMRRRFAALAGRGPQGELADVGGIRTIRYGTGPPAIWLHGGGYVFGSPETHANSAACLAALANISVLVPDYRLAPEHPWPAQLEDIEGMLDGLRGPVPLIGDSAGGHLALTITRIRTDNISKLVLISPNTDRTGKSKTRVRNTPSDLMNSHEDDQQLAQMAMPNIDSTDVHASPLLADLSGLPPTFVTASSNEVLLDDSLLLISALGRAGVSVTADIVSGMMHMWTLWPRELLPARKTLQRISGFLAE